MNTPENKPTFAEYLRNIHGIDMYEYKYELDAKQRRVARNGYISRYGAPILWDERKD